MMDVKELFKTPGLILRKKLTFREDKLRVINKAFVFQREFDHAATLLVELIQSLHGGSCLANVASKECSSEFRPPTILII